ncbi:MAG: hypothetical protein FWG71_10075, partial [Synergistaceae bacterium]|nr:hypothetical protein [Synergistaceae bacterium]
MKKRVYLVCLVCFLFLFLCSPFAEAQDVIGGVVTGDNVNIRSAPSSRGKALAQAAEGDTFLVDPVPIRDGSDNSEWYKILFSTSIMDDTIYQAHKLSQYDFSYPYISARFVRKEPLTDYQQRQLDYLAQGRPVRLKVGDDMSEYWDYTAPYELKTPATLRRDPKTDSEQITLPVGTVIIFNDATEWDFYHDMEETPWIWVMGENKTILGWITAEDWH